MYYVNTDTRSFQSTQARIVAEVAHAWKRQGEDLELSIAYYDKNDMIAITEVGLKRNIKATSRALADEQRKQNRRAK